MRTLHVGLRVSDLGRSLAFYTSVGSWTSSMVTTSSPGSRSIGKPGRLGHDPVGGKVGDSRVQRLDLHDGGG